MIDYVIRNARVAGRHDALTDIAFENGRIAAVEPNLACDAPAHDAEGCLCCGGLVETHIHLDKSCILDRCQIERGTVAEAVQETAAAKRNFTVEDVYLRGRRTLEHCISHGTMRMRTHVELDPGKLTIQFTQPGVELNLGSIGKGYALDRADAFAERLEIRLGDARGNLHQRAPAKLGGGRGRKRR